MKKLLIVLVVVIFLLSTGVIYINQQYLFNPLTFKKDEITYYSWGAYKSPLIMEISNIDKGWETVEISNDDEIKYVLSELKKGQEYHKNFDKNVNHFAITIREPNTEGLNGLIHQFDGYIGDYIRVGQKKIYITDVLNDYIKEKL